MNTGEIDKLVKTPELDVVRVVSLRGREILLVKEVDDVNWKLPGGKIHGGETIFEAFVREIEEELNFRPVRNDILNYLALKIPDSENIRHIFLIKTVDGGDLAPNEEVEAVDYFSLDSLPETKFQGHILSAVEAVTSVV